TRKKRETTAKKEGRIKKRGPQGYSDVPALKHFCLSPLALLRCGLCPLFAFAIYFVWSVSCLGQLPLDRCACACNINAVEGSGACEVGVFRKGLPRVVARAIQVGRESADNEETVHVGGFHCLYSRCRDLLVVHGFGAP